MCASSKPSPWVALFRWTSVGYLAGAASVGVAWATLGTRAEQPADPLRRETVLAHREPESIPPVGAGVAVPVIEEAPVASGESPAEKVPDPEGSGVEPAIDPADAPPDPPEPVPSSPVSPALRINVNTGTLAELDLLPGIGPALAQRIIDERTRAGRFVSLRDLQRVRGIGPKTVEKLEGLVVFE